MRLASVPLSVVPAVRSSADVYNRSGTWLIAIPALMSNVFLTVDARL